MNLQKLAEFRTVIEAMEYPELEPFTGSLKLIYDDQVDYIQKEAGQFTDKLHSVLRKFFPQNAPQEEQPQEPEAFQAGDEVPYGGQTPGGLYVPEQRPQPQMQQADMSFDPKRMPDNDVDPSYKPNRNLRQQVDLEDSENKSQEIAVAVKGFQDFVNKMNQAPHGYDPTFVQGVNQVWKQLKGLIRKYLHEPRRDLRKQVADPNERQMYPPQQNEFLGKYAKNIQYL